MVSACLGQGAILELRVMHQRGALHRTAALVLTPVWPGASTRILVVTRAARSGVLKILMKGMSSGTRSGMTNLCRKCTKVPASPPPRPVVRLDRVEVQPWILTGKCHRRSKDGLFGSCVGIEARLFSAAWFPLTPRTRLCRDIAATSKTHGHGWPAFGVFNSGDDEKRHLRC